MTTYSDKALAQAVRAMAQRYIGPGDIECFIEAVEHYAAEIDAQQSQPISPPARCSCDTDMLSKCSRCEPEQPFTLPKLVGSLLKLPPYEQALVIAYGEWCARTAIDAQKGKAT